MKVRRIGRFLPLIALLAAGLLAAGCSSDKDPSTGGSGGSGGGGGGEGGTGGGSEAVCGNGVLEAGEECDDGNTSNDDCCSYPDCQIINPTCGNGILECGEECDDGNTEGGDGCSEICKEEACGNGYVEADEECDDGNTESGDGCSDKCEVECLIDQDCDADAMEICVRPDEGYGQCLPTGAACDSEANCGSVAREHCDGVGCICQPNDNDDGHYGVCWHRVASCNSCETDAECGTTSIFNRPADCVTYHVAGMGDQNVCLPRNLPQMTCPPGFVVGTEDDGGLDMTRYCVPQRGMCPVNPCKKDQDCTDPRFPVCDLAREICIPGCYINWQQNLETVGCSPGKPACHALPERFDPALLGSCETAPMFGYGKCGPECETDLDCSNKGTDILGRPFICQNDGGVRRCRPEGCVDDMECPEPGPGAEYMGYCSPDTLECTTANCRTGVDPRKGCGVNEPYMDCNMTHKCVEDNPEEDDGYGICVLKNCIDNGGANLDCYGGQFCAGEQMRSMMTGEVESEPLPVPDGTPIGECYDMNEALWCSTTCTPGDNSTCRGEGLPGRSALNPSYCFPTMAGNFCYFGCQYGAECPAGWGCTSDYLRLQGTLPEMGYKMCEEDFHCGEGSRCVEPKVNGVVWTNWGRIQPDPVNQPDLWLNQPPFKVCTCTEDNQCGSNGKCNAGIRTRDPKDFNTEVERYCTVDTENLCGPNGSVEWVGAWGLAEDGSFYNIFECGCTPGSTGMCPLMGPSGTIMQDSPTHCGMSQGDKFTCVGGMVCDRIEWNDPDTGETYCGVRRVNKPQD